MNGRLIVYVYLLLLLLVGCYSKPEISKEKQQAAAERQGKYVPVESIVGKTVSSIKNVQNGVLVTFDDGSMISLSCYKYSIEENEH